METEQSSGAAGERYRGGGVVKVDDFTTGTRLQKTSGISGLREAPAPTADFPRRRRSQSHGVYPDMLEQQAGVSSIRLSCHKNDATRMFRHGSGRKEVHTAQKNPQIRSLAPGDVVPAREQAEGRKHVLQGLGVDRCLKYYMEPPCVKEPPTAGGRRLYNGKGTTSYRMQLLLTPKPCPAREAAREIEGIQPADPIEQWMLSPPKTITYCRKRPFSEKGMSSACIAGVIEQGEKPRCRFPPDCARSLYNKPTDIFGVNYIAPRSRRTGENQRCHLTASHMGVQPSDESLIKCSDVNPKFMTRRRPQVTRFSSVFQSDLVPAAPDKGPPVIGFPGLEAQGKDCSKLGKELLGQPPVAPRYPGQYPRAAPLRGRRHYEVPWNSDSVMIADARLLENN